MEAVIIIPSSPRCRQRRLLPRLLPQETLTSKSCTIRCSAPLQKSPVHPTFPQLSRLILSITILLTVSIATNLLAHISRQGSTLNPAVSLPLSSPPPLSSSLSLHQPPPAPVTTTVPSLLRQRIPPLQLRARGRALFQDCLAPPPPLPPPTPPTCRKPDPSSTILTPRLLLQPSPRPSSASFPCHTSSYLHCLSLQISTTVHSNRVLGKRHSRTPCRAPSAARLTIRSKAFQQNTRGTAPGEQ